MVGNFGWVLWLFGQSCLRRNNIWAHFQTRMRVHLLNKEGDSVNEGSYLLGCVSQGWKSWRHWFLHFLRGLGVKIDPHHTTTCPFLGLFHHCMAFPWTSLTLTISFSSSSIFEFLKHCLTIRSGGLGIIFDLNVMLWNDHTLRNCTHSCGRTGRKRSAIPVACSRGRPNPGENIYLAYATNYSYIVKHKII